MGEDVLARKKEMVSYLISNGVLVESSLLADGQGLEELYSRTVSLASQKKDTTDVDDAGSDAKDDAENSEKNSLGLELIQPQIQSAQAQQAQSISIENQNIYPDIVCTSPAKARECQIIFSYDAPNRKRTMQDFVSHYNKRYLGIRNFLLERQELKNTISIARASSKSEKEEVCVIGMVLSKNKTSNNNIMIELEDPTGVIRVLITQKNPEVFRLANEITMDEVIGIMGMTGSKIIFANNVVRPDIPGRETKKLPEDIYAIFLSDLHIGSKKFLGESFEKFLMWINRELGDDTQKETAEKVKYIFIMGDLVDGVGIYPDQYHELDISDIYGQYKKCAEYLKKIPGSIRIIICPGNHDAVRISEPQPGFNREFARPLFEMPNITIVSNPSLVRIESSDEFPGFDVLLYHGYSFDFFIAEMDNIREQGGYDRPDLVMKFLLKRRHLAPTHTSTLFIPDPAFDPLIIDKIPDFFACGHLHKVAVANYKSTTLICGSCWQSRTSFQEKVGHHPEPGRVPLVNLKTRQVKLLRFTEKEEDEK